MPQHAGDVEKANRKPKPINGFPRVASKIASDPDKTSTIYRRFDRLSARNLLFLEAEIAEFEALQDEYDVTDLKHQDDMTINCHSDWREFVKYADEKHADGKFAQPRQRGRMELALKIKEKLKEYRKILIAGETSHEQC